MVINFICRASKADKSGQSPLEVSIIINGVRRYVHLDRKVKAADFNPKTQKVKRDASTNEYLVALRTKLYSLETEMLRNVGYYRHLHRCFQEWLEPKHLHPPQDV